ncbi:MAG: leucine-rich repeat protein, partial [Bacteroidota bacterium]
MKTLFKKILLLALFVVCSNFTAQAQYVTIPDANFRVFLQQSYSGCFNGQGLMDTTCTAVVAAANMYCSNQGIASLEGVQYFDGLQRLYCNNNQLTSLPALPATLQYLYCYNNQLTSLPALPATLQRLYCNNNQLTSLPALPAALQYLDCDTNQLTSLPALPATLQYFYC